MAYSTIGPLVAALLAQAGPSPSPEPAISPIEATYIGSIVVGAITALGTQLNPMVRGWWEDRKHAREIAAMDMVNDLKHCNEKVAQIEKLLALMTLDRDHWRDAADRHADELAAIRDGQASPLPPKSLPPPSPPESPSP